MKGNKDGTNRFLRGMTITPPAQNRKENTPPTDNDVDSKAASSARSLLQSTGLSQLRNRWFGYQQLGDQHEPETTTTGQTVQTSSTGVGAQPDALPDMEDVVEEPGNAISAFGRDRTSGTDVSNQVLSTPVLVLVQFLTHLEQTSITHPEQTSTDEQYRSAVAKLDHWMQTPQPSSRCRGCSETALDEAYILRLFDLTVPLHCHACNEEHPTVQFSPSQRDTTIRTCIARQGYRTLCSHWNITLDDLREWQNHIKRQAGGVYVKSTHPAHQDDAPESDRCPFGNLTVRVFEGSTELCVHVTWESVIKVDTQELDGFEICKKILDDLHDLCPEALGPPHLTSHHIRSVTRESLFDDALYLDHDRCLYLENMDGLIEGDGYPTVKYESRLMIPVLAEVDPTILDGLWPVYIDPRSYGLRDDELGRGITWCDDMNCPTMRGRVQWEVVAEKMSTGVLSNQYMWDGCVLPQRREDVPVRNQKRLLSQFERETKTMWLNREEWTRC
ncbi:uncharacterized protein F5Z01DRAFT_687288 [Emericellopsis atlantica]|uniref:Uncharacterized protein n=1 Tax=Emericellopsis atlantica TaxID=2614577 RepID=A0A9P7ZMQ8_9HYPO|nr:uncharacterized protein F5Z01DRAFT_687288 [Emericellopsis atlantica]KAG9254511.1 hypothetical protein F5Z01DRAFT_687288 [Emericellopsis atlantica]